jgi:predicted ATPase
MELNGIVASLPLIAAVVGVISGTITVVLGLLRGYRHVRQRAKQAVQPPRAEGLAGFAPNTRTAEALPAPGIRTPDQRLRVFVSSTLQELSPERAAARQAISRLRLTPVLFELGARPHPPRDLYRAYLAQSDVFVGIYWQKYGWVAPGEDVSGLEDEYRLAGNKPKLMYLKTPAPERESQLAKLLARIRADDHVSYKSFRTATELRGLIADDLALLLTERFAHRGAVQPTDSLASPTSPRSSSHTNLPIQTTSFVGRESELDEIKRLIDSSRLLTLTGAGGVGKTRLAMRAAADVLERFADGVWLVELAPVGQSELVPHVVARAVGVREEPGQQVIDTLASALQARQLLLVLDNCEHLIEACARLADTLLHSCGRLHVVTTSRESLNVAGETVYQVPPLQVAMPSQTSGIDSIARYEAVRLFADRAIAALPTFSVTEHNAQPIAELCYRLDGIPLAIELAAARVKVLTPDQISQRLDDRFRLLSVGSRTAVPRQQTLRALVDWSYDLLSDQDKALFRRLSVFAGGWTLEAAEAVCTADPIGPGELLDRLSALVDKSLVLAGEQPDGQMRYRLLETLREYAAERLGESSERETALHRHAEHYLNAAERIDEVRKRNWRQWRLEGWPWLDAELDNFRAVLGRCQDGSVDSGGQLEMGLRLCVSLWWFHGVYARVNEQRDWHRSLLANTPARVSPARFYATWYLGLTAGAGMARFQESGALLSEARTLANALREDQEIALAEGGTGQDFLWQGRLSEAEEFNERGLALARRVGPRCYLPIHLFNAGWTALRQGRLERAAELLDESIKLAREIGDEFELSMALPLRGTVSLLRQDLIGAREYLQEAEEVTEGLPVSGMGLPSLGLGKLALLEGDNDGAVDRFITVLHIAAQTGTRGMMCESLDGLAFVAAARGYARGAVRLLAAVEQVRGSIHQGRAPYDQQRVEASLAQLREAIGDAGFDAEWQAGQQLSLDEAIAYGRALGGDPHPGPE